MALASYDKGDQERLQVTWRNAAGALTDTTTVLKLRDPSGTITTLTPTSGGAGTGNYYYDKTWDQSALWTWRFIASGALVAEEQGAAWVRYSNF